MTTDPFKGSRVKRFNKATGKLEYVLGAPKPGDTIETTPEQGDVEQMTQGRARQAPSANDLQNLGQPQSSRMNTRSAFANAQEGRRIVKAMEKQAAVDATKEEVYSKYREARKSASDSKAITGSAPSPNASMADMEKYQRQLEGQIANKENSGKRDESQVNRDVFASSMANQVASAKKQLAINSNPQSPFARQKTTDPDRRRNMNEVSADMAERGIKGGVAVQGDTGNFVAAGDGKSGVSYKAPLNPGQATSTRKPEFQVTDQAGKEKYVSPAETVNYARIKDGVYGGMTVDKARTIDDINKRESADAFSTKVRSDAAMQASLSTGGKVNPSDFRDAEQLGYEARRSQRAKELRKAGI